MSLNALDLFCGMGGLSWGLKATGLINPVWAVDKHHSSLDLYRRNFPDSNALSLDLSQSADISKLIEKINFYGKYVEVVIGGSPCQGFTQIRNGQDTQSDPHNHLVIRFAEIVRTLNPILFIYENVPRLQLFPIFPKFLGRLRGKGCYKVSYAVVEAANFGTPSRRTRLFVVGFRGDLRLTPEISRGLDIPYQQFWWKRNVQDNKITYSTRLSKTWKSVLLDSNDLRLVNVEQAINDLPSLQPGTSSGMLTYATPPQSAYQKWARQGTNKSDGHVVPLIRTETQTRLKAIPPGGNWRDLPEPLTYKIPYDLRSGILKRRHYSAYRRLLPEGHSPTVQGHADFAYHHQYERALTPRELARLMGFQDKFQLGQGYEAAMQAIGNAVPPPMVTGIATDLLRQLGMIN